MRDFLLEDLDNCYSTFQDLREKINHISIPKKRFTSKKTLFSEKLIAFLYSSMVNFCKTDKVKGIPLSQKLIENVLAIMENTLHTPLARNWGNKRLCSFFLQRKSKEKLFQNTSGRS